MVCKQEIQHTKAVRLFSEFFLFSVFPSYSIQNTLSFKCLGVSKIYKKLILLFSKVSRMVVVSARRKE